MGRIKEMLSYKEEGKCPFCKQPVDINEFRDELSIKEYNISGMCQKCQDEFFKE